MKSIRLVLAAVAVATALVPSVASAYNGCTIYWTEEQVGPFTVRKPNCAW